MLTAHIFRRGEAQGTVPIERVREELDRDDSTRAWIDAQEPGPEDLAAIEKVVELHPLTIEDALHWRQRSKVEFFADYFTVVLRALEQDVHGELIDREVHAIVLPNLLITFRRDPGSRLPAAIERIRSQRELAVQGPAAFLYVMLDGVVDEYLSIAERFEEVADDLEDRAFDDATGTGVQNDLIRAKRRVSVFRRTVAPVREIVDMIRDRPEINSEKLAPYYRDLLDHALRTLEFADNVRDVLQSAIETQRAQVANRTNVIMKRVTSWGSILLVPTLISGVYGMNFRYMPELDWRFGYAMALALMGITAFALHRMFRKRDWL
ncbi:MAG: magnesium transporter CorA family protein [Actinomycetota bacterium]